VELSQIYTLGDPEQEKCGTVWAAASGRTHACTHARTAEMTPPTTPPLTAGHFEIIMRNSAKPSLHQYTNTVSAQIAPKLLQPSPEVAHDDKRCPMTVPR
jgi:hypothetical protein